MQQSNGGAPDEHKSTKAQKHKSTKNESHIGTTRPINLILFFTLTFFIANSFCTLFLPQAASALTKPTLVSPANNAQITTTSATFTWTHPYNDQYELKIKTSGGTLKYASGKISSKSKTVNLAGIPLTAGSTYKWYVVVYANGQQDSSADRYFTYNPVTTGNVTGKLHIGSATGAGLSGATATCGGKSTTTASDGSYTISRVPQGAQTLSFSKTGYQSYSRAVVITAGKTFSAGDNYLVANVTDDYGNNCSNATSMSVNTSKAGNIETAGDYDYFKIEVPSSGTLTVYTKGSTDTYGYIKNSSCSNLTGLSGNADDYKGINFRLWGTVTKGIYYVAVKNYLSTGTGAYTLYVDWGVDVSRLTPIADYAGHLGADYSPLSAGTPILSPVDGKVTDLGVKDGYGTMGVAIEVSLSNYRSFTTEYPLSSNTFFTLSTNKVVCIFGHLRPSKDLKTGTAVQRFDAGKGELSYTVGQTIGRGTRIGYIETHPYEGDSTNSHVHVTCSDALNPPATGIWRGHNMPSTDVNRKKYIKPELAWPNLQK